MREYAYDRTDKLQQFNKGWDEAVAKGWTVVSMKDDWKTVSSRDSSRHSTILLNSSPGYTSLSWAYRLGG